MLIERARPSICELSRWTEHRLDLANIMGVLQLTRRAGVSAAIRHASLHLVLKILRGI
jgi:hypothetical protein